jgi:hypothetical protein
MVALMSMLLALDNGFQTCLMAPTEILAQQHYQTFIDLLKPLAINVELLTGNTKTKQRKQTLEQLKNGELNLLIGTHALIEDPVVFKNLGLVVIDEAYHAFAQDSFLPQLAEYPNLLVMRTVSKLGLAGLRLGFLAGNPSWLHEIDKLRLPYNINVLTQTVAEFVLSHHEILDQQAAQLRHERTKLFDTLQDMAHVVAYPSDANFILLRVPQADLVHQRLLQQQILVKNLHHAHPLLHDCLRVTVSTPEENAQFIHALQKSLLGKS